MNIRCPVFDKCVWQIGNQNTLQCCFWYKWDGDNEHFAHGEHTANVMFGCILRNESIVLNHKFHSIYNHLLHFSRFTVFFHFFLVFIRDSFLTDVCGCFCVFVFWMNGIGCEILVCFSTIFFLESKNERRLQVCIRISRFRLRIIL